MYRCSIIITILGALSMLTMTVKACSCAIPEHKYTTSKSAVVSDPLRDLLLAFRKPIEQNELHSVFGITTSTPGTNVAWEDFERAALRSGNTTPLPYAYVEVTSHEEFGVTVHHRVELFESSGLCKYTVKFVNAVCCRIRSRTTDEYLGVFRVLSDGTINLYMAQDNLGTTRPTSWYQKTIPVGITPTAPPDVFQVPLSVFVRLMELRQYNVIKQPSHGQQVTSVNDVQQRLQILADKRTMTYWRSQAVPPPSWFHDRCMTSTYLRTATLPYNDNYRSIIYLEEPIGFSTRRSKVTRLSKKITLCRNGLAELKIDEGVFCPGIGQDTLSLQLLGTYVVDGDGVVRLQLGGPQTALMINGTLEELMAHTSYPENAAAVGLCSDEIADALYEAFDPPSNVEESSSNTAANFINEDDNIERNNIGETPKALEALLTSFPVFHEGFITTPNDVKMAFQAAERGDAITIKSLLSQNRLRADSERLGLRETLSHVAAAAGHVEVLRALIESGVDLTRSNILNETALFFAAIHRREICVRLLVEELLNHGLAASATAAETVYGWSSALAAVHNNDSAVLEALLLDGRSQFDVNQLSSSHRTLLYEAATQGHLAVLDVLLGAAADPAILSSNAQYRLMESALLGAVRNGHVEVALRLLGRTAASPLNLSSPEYTGVLHVAAYQCQLPVVEAVLLRGVVVDGGGIDDASIHKNTLQDNNFKGTHTPLSATARCDDDALMNTSTIPIARLLSEHGSTVQCRSRCPLIEAILNRQRHHKRYGNAKNGYNRSASPDLVDLILDYQHHVDFINGVDTSGQSAIAVATQSDLILKLLELGANPLIGYVLDGSNRQVTALHAAASRSNIDLLNKLLLGAQRLGGDDVESPSGGETLLHAALYRSRVKNETIDGIKRTIELLLNFIAPGCEPSEQQCTAAPKQGSTWLQSWINVTGVEERSGDSPLMLVGSWSAALGSHLRIVEVIDLLLAHGADINHKNDRGATLLMKVAENHNHKDSTTLVEYLLRRGANVTAVDENGHMALHRVIENNSNVARSKSSLISALLEAEPATIHIPDKLGRTPLIATVLHLNNSDDTKYAIVETLLKYGASPTKEMWQGKNALQHAIAIKETGRRHHGYAEVEDRLITLLGSHV